MTDSGMIALLLAVVWRAAPSAKPKESIDVPPYLACQTTMTAQLCGVGRRAEDWGRYDLSSVPERTGKCV